ncbi:hypothetical protein Dimus_008750 [Dionaea muscipula]
MEGGPGRRWPTGAAGQERGKESGKAMCLSQISGQDGRIFAGQDGRISVGQAGRPASRVGLAGYPIGRVGKVRACDSRLGQEEREERIG